jgi:hypothetical protein
MNPTGAPQNETRHAGGVIWHLVGPPLFREDPLQELIEGRPALLPLVNEGPVAVAAELKVPKGGRADVVVVDAEGHITIVETKLATNGDFRDVLSQILSYAGGLYGLDYNRFRDRFAAARRTTGLIAPFEASGEAWEEDIFRDRVGEHLKAGAFDLVIAVNVVTEGLVQTVELLDDQTPEHFRLSILVWGESATPIRHVPRPADKTPEDLVVGIHRRDPRAGEAAQALLGWITEHGLEMDCNNGKDGVVKGPEGETLFSVMGHQEMVRVPVRGLRAEGVDSASIERLVEDLSALGFESNERRSKASLATLAEADAVFAFTALMERLLEQA